MVELVALMGKLYMGYKDDGNGRTLLLQLVSEPIYSSHERYRTIGSWVA